VPKKRTPVAERQRDSREKIANSNGGVVGNRPDAGLAAGARKGADVGR